METINEHSSRSTNQMYNQYKIYSMKENLFITY